MLESTSLCAAQMYSIFCNENGGFDARRYAEMPGSVHHPLGVEAVLHQPPGRIASIPSDKNA
jgi:hypothetical protein